MSDSDMRSPVEILTAARARIEDRGHFVMGALAWNRQGRRVEPESPDAWRWSPCGAIQAETGIRPPVTFNEYARSHQLYRLLDRAGRSIGGNPAHDVTENLGHGDSLRMFDEAIRLAGESA